MRTLIASALLALACGCADRPSRPSGADATPSIPGGPDPVVLRVARDGGILTAYRYPALDSVLWKSGSRAPALAAVIAFGAEDGYLAAMDAQRAPVRVDLRLGVVTSSRDSGQLVLSSSDGAAIYALTRAGEITRFTPSGGDWKFKPTLPASALFAQADGSLIVAGASGSKAVVWRIRPPGQEIVDTISFDVGGKAGANAAMIAATAGSLGDRIFFGANESVIAVRSRDMQKALEIDLGDPVRALVATPSGDRLFAALDDNRSVRIIDRFEERVTGKIKLPAAPTALRMDPLGRMLLARGPADSVYVVSLADDGVRGTVRSAWRADLPMVLADGAIAMARGGDVVITKAPTLDDGRSIARGAQDFWHSFRWNGFRPRAAGLDQPVQFRTSAPRDSTDLVDTASVTKLDSAMQASFTVSFAAVQNEKTARDLVSRIRVDGQAPRITTSERNGTTLYRVVMGPYPTRAEADRVGRASGQSYWIFEGTP
ncbi:MAG: SPOR domain-containing protein [Gemmatimonadaceae bacterium]|nr:SPOR domain-containing protein [Gemmatimonadaceae bacterium]